MHTHCKVVICCGLHTIMPSMDIFSRKKKKSYAFDSRYIWSDNRYIYFRAWEKYYWFIPCRPYIPHPLPLWYMLLQLAWKGLGSLAWNVQLRYYQMTWCHSCMGACSQVVMTTDSRCITFCAIFNQCDTNNKCVSQNMKVWISIRPSRYVQVCW